MKAEKARDMFESLRLGDRLPVLGIGAFSGCSVNSLANLFLSKAKHPTQLLWFAAGLVELTTAWLVYQVVEQTRKVTKSNISKQDRRFYSIILAAFAVLAVPSLALTVVANALEFGNALLGFVFPLLSVGCAIGAALPDTVNRFEKKKAKEKAEADRKATDKRGEKERKKQEKLEQDRARIEQATRKKLATVGNAAETYRQYQENPMQTQANVAQALGITRQAVGQHLTRLEQAGLIRRNGSGVEILER